ncbi:hypothetical protein [Paenibacillus wynnii]|uniref:Lipoprotein n=1 Tax=Paenibacillus wynnii TaxID=268407 RepID=A0A098M529_9BACL|nr:hypothetical protein [Paenibacillus wynnii]KGE17143.1 hypothetical protein PWYN_21120 [Paenibacillus wynnii]
MIKYSSFAITTLLVIVLVGCSNKTTEYPHVIIFNNTQFYLSVEKVTLDRLGNQVGAVKRQVDQMPQKNEESNFTPVGSKLYEIKEIDPNEAIAVELDGEYQKASSK